VSTTAREIMDAAILLQDGERIITKCPSYEEMEKLRVYLYKTRTQMLKTHKEMAYSLYISRETNEEGFFVVVAKEMTVEGVVVIDKDGNVRPFTRKEHVPAADEDSTERMRRLMAEDGMTEEEIEDALAQKGEEDFDEAASKIEEMQGITE